MFGVKKADLEPLRLRNVDHKIVLVPKSPARTKQEHISVDMIRRSVRERKPSYKGQDVLRLEVGFFGAEGSLGLKDSIY